MTLYKSRQNSILLPIPRPKTIKTRVKDRHYEQPYYYNMTNHTHISKQTSGLTRYFRVRKTILKLLMIIHSGVKIFIRISDTDTLGIFYRLSVMSLVAKI